MSIKIYPVKKGISGLIEVPPDKSITHRALMLASECDGTSFIINPSRCGDCLSTFDCIRNLGIEIEEINNQYKVVGRGIGKLKSYNEPLNTGNSGTTMRLLSGILSRYPHEFTLTGDASLEKRPMERIAEPLRKMGADVETTNGCPPINIKGGKLKGINYELPIASAQIKSAIMFAAFGAENKTELSGKISSRDHTERLFRYVGIPCEYDDFSITIEPVSKISPFKVEIPGDASSAAFFAAAVSIAPASKIVLKNINLNPTRISFFEVLKQMGAKITYEQMSIFPEPAGNVEIENTQLKAVKIEASKIPYLIDELPLVAVLANFAHGTTVVTNAEELRRKESDRISSIVTELRKMGSEIEELTDGFVVEGPAELKGAIIDSHGDHRIAMAMTIAALGAKGESTICDTECVNISFPGFYDKLNSMIK